MFDLKEIRLDPAKYDKGWRRRGLSPQTQDILHLDQEVRDIKTELQQIQQERNEKSRLIGEYKKKGEDTAGIMDEVSALKEKLSALEDRQRTKEESLHMHLGALPNLMAPDVPDGKDEEDNKELDRWGEIRTQSSPAHDDIGEALGLINFKAAARMSGSRFVVISGALAKLERALGHFFLDVHTQEHGYLEVSPPLLVRDNAMFGTGQLPKFADEQYRTTRGDWLIPTAEVPLSNLVAEQILEEETLPLRYTAFTPCFRQEAGSAGKDTKGMLRQHQFYKVELVSVTKAEQSAVEHERKLECAQAVLKKLDLPFRTVLLCSGDTAFTSQKTYDIEVWMPGQQKYREISSCSNTGDFQARRMNARYRRSGEKSVNFAHVLNGSGVAVGRALIAVMENYYDPQDGGIFIPEVLVPYMDGLTKICPA